MATFLTVIIFGVLGAVFGSFFNCIICRSRYTQIVTQNNAEIIDKLSFWRGRSECPKCGHKLGFFDLIPVLSFIFLRGRCRYCKQKISWQYPIMELITAGLFIFTVWFHGVLSIAGSQGLVVVIRDLIFVSFLLLIFLFDFKYSLIPDRISIPAIVVAFGFNIFLIFTAFSSARGGSAFGGNLPLLGGGGGKVGEIFSVIPQLDWGIQILKLFLAILIGGGFFGAQYLISKGKWIGGGDIRLGALMGAMLSLPNILLALFLAYVTGAIYGITALILKKKTFKSEVPFGTFLTASTFIVLFYGTKIIQYYLRLLN